MSYSIVPEQLNIELIISKIRLFRNNFHEYEKTFIQCKSEQYYLTIQERVPQHRFELEEIYAKGRDVAIAVNSDIYDMTEPTITPTLKSLVDNLIYSLSIRKKLSKDTYEKVEDLCQKIDFYDWAIQTMINTNKNMCIDIDHIIQMLELLKQTKTYQLESGSLAMSDLDKQQIVPQTIHNYSGSFQQSQFQSGSNSTMNINQINNQALQQVCNQMREIIDQSSETPETKQNLKNIVAEVETTNNPSTFKDAYTKLTSALSNHLTILGAFGSAGILTELTKYLG
ncbi:MULTISPECIES: hypothetical protein [unclassified Acinetobacter]|uniref:hypothetical protein n=1 Tax=unclassified Acinetobacter TaxID=196816 RepID=UPI002578650D|nr:MULTISPECIES: hypothetical protein [unclassified Acinetobacter]MDM1763000.1 hypothetical protein [Acinetobacter sp. 226-1]MDM1766479.1 hypothetical protein [Acinetobacter sp. 226-4]